MQVSEGRTLFGAGELNDMTYTAGETIDAGLPNITGYVRDVASAGSDGSIYSDSFGSVHVGTGGGNARFGYVRLDASKSSPIYGNSETVQPNAYVVYMFKRTK